MSDQTIRTACPYCGVGCGVVANVSSDGHVSVAGDPDHPANQGRLCSKGSALAETLTAGNRLLQPVVNHEAVSWETALTHVAESLTQTINNHGRESVAFYVSGQLLTEDYYVVNKLTKGWLGTANIDTNSRLCMASSVTGHKRAFGTDTVPGCYEDLQQADLIVLVGSNLAWCHPVLHQRIMTEKQRRPELLLIAIDPRRTATADLADMHLAIRPDGDTLLFNGLLAHLADQGVCDLDYISEHVNGFDAAVTQAHAHSDVDTDKHAPSMSIDQMAEALGIEAQQLLAFYHHVADTPKTVTLFSQGVNQSRSGTDKVNAIINTHLATGRIGKPGMGPFSITGQPNAMGGREVGGLATMLAAHMELSSSHHRDIVQRFWQSPHIANKPGLCAVDLFNAVANGSIKAIWIMGTNPVDSLPDADGVGAALTACPLVIVSDINASTDTVAFADVLLPAQAWGEKEGTVTNSERCISRQRAVRAPAGNARPDWWAVSEVAKRMGYSHGFDYHCAADIFREHAALSALDNNGSRDFDIGAAATLTDVDYQHMAPFYWPWIEGEASAKPIRFFANGHFFTTDGKAQMTVIVAAKPGNDRLCDRYPMIMNTGRIRDQWHTMTRTGYSPRLSSHLGEPYIEIHPQDALIHGISDADIVNTHSRRGSCLLRVSLSERQLPGQVFTPMHWSNIFASSARVDSLVESFTDPHSQQPALKNQPVSIQRFNAGSFGYVLNRQTFTSAALNDIQYWALSPVERGWRYEMASELGPTQLLSLLDSLCQASQLALPYAHEPAFAHLHDPAYKPATAPSREPVTATRPGSTATDETSGLGNRNAMDNIESLSYSDSATRTLKTAIFRGTQLQSLVFVADEPVEVSRSWAQQQFVADWSSRSERFKLLAGRASADKPDKGAIVCSCFQVGITEIETAVTRFKCHDLQSIGQRLQAGTNCGSCRSEVQGLINRCTQTLNRKCTTSPSRMM